MGRWRKTSLTLAGMSAVLRTVELTKMYPPVQGHQHPLTIFRDLSLALSQGEMLAIVGESGAGKSTLLHILAALDQPTAGQVFFGEKEITRLAPAAAAAYRNTDVGYVWQAHYLLPEFSALENVAMPLLARGLARWKALEEAALWLDRVGLTERAHNRAGELSGGEQQRISLARALVTRPKVLLADEPTGNLDTGTAEAVFDLLQSLHREQGLASILVTHNLALAARCDRVLRLRAGELVGQS